VKLKNLTSTLLFTVYGEKSEVEKYFCGFAAVVCRILSLFTEGWEKNHPLSPLIAAKKEV
jgi:hypothetical protein